MTMTTVNPASIGKCFGTFLDTNNIHVAPSPHQDKPGAYISPESFASLAGESDCRRAGHYAREARRLRTAYIGNDGNLCRIGADRAHTAALYAYWGASENPRLYGFYASLHEYLAQGTTGNPLTRGRHRARAAWARANEAQHARIGDDAWGVLESSLAGLVEGNTRLAREKRDELVSFLMTARAQSMLPSRYPLTVDNALQILGNGNRATPDAFYNGLKAVLSLDANGNFPEVPDVRLMELGKYNGGSAMSVAVEDNFCRWHILHCLVSVESAKSACGAKGQGPAVTMKAMRRGIVAD